MPQKRNANKKQGFRRVLKPDFVNASELPSSSISDTVPEFSPDNINNERKHLNVNSELVKNPILTILHRNFLLIKYFPFLTIVILIMLLLNSKCSCFSSF